MWTRSLLKENAKQALRGRYWRCFVVCLIVSLLGGGFVSTPSVSLNYTDSGDLLEYWLGQLPAATLTALMWAFIIACVLALLWAIFLSSVLTVGGCRYFMESRQAPSPIGTVFSVFRTPYLNVVKVQFLTTLKIVGVVLLCMVLCLFLVFLTPGLMMPSLALLLIVLSFIPVIYLSYCYVLVPYLLAENPCLTAGRAMELSKQMMYGEKWHYFVLRLSFIGWDLLCLLTFGIGNYFLAPYIQATMAEFYAAMRAKALSAGFSTTEELGGFVRHDSGSF